LAIAGIWRESRRNGRGKEYKRETDFLGVVALEMRTGVEQTNLFSAGPIARRVPD
jgi:hypothetical protein